MFLLVLESTSTDALDSIGSRSLMKPVPNGLATYSVVKEEY